MVVDVCSHSLKRMRKEGLEFKATLTYTGSHCLKKNRKSKTNKNPSKFFDQHLKLFTHETNKTKIFFSFV